MRGGKYFFSVAKHDPLSTVNRKSPNSQPKKISDVDRTSIKRPNKFKTDSWYEAAALSMAISAKRDQSLHERQKEILRVRYQR